MQVRKHGGRPPKGVIDFSTPLNPLGPPRELEAILERLVAEKRHRTYPDYEYREFREAVARFHGIDEEGIIPLNGSAEVLTLIMAALRPKKLISVEPTFGDHRLLALATGTKLVTRPLTEDRNTFKLDPDIICGLPPQALDGAVIILSNPNNPTGSVAGREAINEILDCARKAIVIVDEAFMDLAERGESALGLPADNLVVTRSFTKSLSIPGLRVGFAYTPNRDLARRLDAVRQPWNLNMLAAESITEFLNEGGTARAFLKVSRAVIEKERSWLTSNLVRLGLRVYESRAPYILIKHHIPNPLFVKSLVRAGVYARDASSFSHLTSRYTRVSVRLRNDNSFLIEALKIILSPDGVGGGRRGSEG